MKTSKKGSTKPRARVSKSQFVTKSGNVVKIRRSLGEKWTNRRDSRQKRRAERMAGLPKNRVLRFFYHFQPRRVYKYWFSRDGALMALRVMGVGIVLVFVFLIGLFAYFRKDLPNLNDVTGDNIGGSVRYYDRTGKVLLWEDYDAVKRIPIDSKDMSNYIKQATVAVEDKDFYHHGGFDVKGIIRAGINNVTGHGTTQGGSTITQQLVKLSEDWTNNRSYSRKIKEIILAVELERSYSKDKILEGYLNTAPYGGIEYGVEAAARDYFNKSAKDLSLAEAAYLAAIPKSPRYYSKYSTDFDKAAAVSRSHYILDLMKDQGMITKDQENKALKVDVIAKVKPRKAKYSGIKAPWFVLAAKNQLEFQVGSQSAVRDGWTVTTTLDLDLQKIAEDAVAQGIGEVRAQGGDNAAFTAEDVKTGQVVAQVGGQDFTNKDYGQINYAQHPLPPGSSFKPYDYMTLIENSTNAGAGSVIYDRVGPLDGYPCTISSGPNKNCLTDYDYRQPGAETIRYALGGSRNIPAVKAMLIAGIDKTIGTAEKFLDPDPTTQDNNGFGYNCFYDQQLQKKAPCYSSSAIGDGAYLHLDQHVHGYATIARLGENIPQTYILKIVKSDGKVLDEWHQEKGVQVVRKDTAYIMADMLSDPNPSYFPSWAKPQRYGAWHFGMKTGTTNDAKDGWMMGFSTQYAAGVWVGNHTREVAMSGSMETMTLPIWQYWMRKTHDRIKDVTNWTRPSDIQVLPAYVIHNHVGYGSIEPSPAKDLFPYWYKPNKPGAITSQVLDKVSKKLATSCTPDLAKETISNANANTFSVDIFVDANKTTTTTEKDDVHRCGDAPPTISSLTISDSNVISAVVYQGTHPLNSGSFPGTVNFIANGKVVKTVHVTTDGQTVTYNASALSSGTKVSAQVIDSVLYTGTSPNSVTTKSSGGSGGSDTITLSVVDNGSNIYEFDWNTIPTATDYDICIDDITTSGHSYSCSPGSSGDTKTIPGGGTAYIQSNNGITSNSVNF